jgi:hypothetical protein
VSGRLAAYANRRISSQLLREFLSAHAPVLEWDNFKNGYKAHGKFKVH